MKHYSKYLLILVTTLISITSIEARMPTRIGEETPRKYWQFIFLLETTTAPGQSEFIFHPFYGNYKNEEKAYEFHHALYPLFMGHGTNYWKKWSLFYFFTGDDRYHKDKKEDSDLFLSPLFHFGSGADPSEDYYSFFPLYGKMKSKFGWDEINYVLFPLYSNWSGKNYKAHSLLWPIIMWGGGRHRSDFRIFPIYSKKEHQGKYVRRTFLWPFFQWSSEGLDKRDPRYVFFSFPLYGHKWTDSGDMSAHTFLWLPFLGGLFAYGEDTRRNSIEFNALFFLYQYSYFEDPTIRKHIIFPFYGTYRFGTALDKAQLKKEQTEGVQFDKHKQSRKVSPFYKEATFITPLYVNLKTSSVIVESDYHVLIPFYWNMERFHRKEREFEYYQKIWPLFSWISSDTGRTEFRSLTLWPFRSDQFERTWGTLYSLFEYNTYTNGDKYLSFLFRLYSYYWNANEDHHFLAGFEYRNTPEYWSIEFLGGFLGYRYDIPHTNNDLLQPRSTIRLMWFDI